MIKKLYKEHIKTQQKRLEHVLKETQFDGLVISSGSTSFFYADDRALPFRATPHFQHWCPENSPYHLLHLKPGQKPKLYFYSPDDFWHEPPSVHSADWVDEFDIVSFSDLKERWSGVGNLTRHAFVGPELQEASENGLDIQNKSLLHYLDWNRSEKTEYEIYCLEKATELGAKGHRAVRKAFQEGASELEAYFAYLSAIPTTEEELPYHSIICLDEKSAILHYQTKRQDYREGKVLLIDAGAHFKNYASDITRTYLRRSSSKIFETLLSETEKLQQEMCTKLKAGVVFRDLHEECHHGVAKILLDTGVLKDCTVESAVSKKLTQSFYPHGLGHMLGLQVHDVGGLQVNAQGDPVSNEDNTNLRFRRVLREKEVVTIEPGIYFIPTKLKHLQGGEFASFCNWKLIEELTPFGGIRIEDDMVVEKEHSRNLTREYLDNEFLV